MDEETRKRAEEAADRWLAKMRQTRLGRMLFGSDEATRMARAGFAAGIRNIELGAGAGVRDIQKIEANVIHACAACRAPGVWKSEPSIKEGWPGCWVEPGDILKDQPVGPQCPNCGAERPGDRSLGVIWEKGH